MIPKHAISLRGGFVSTLLVLLFPTFSSGADAHPPIGVGGARTLGVNTAYPSSDPLLSSSRYRGGIDGDTIVFHIAQFGRNNPAWFYSYDRGETWHAAVTELDNDYSLWYMDYHSSGWFSGKSGFHTSWRYRTSQNRPLYRHISSPYTVDAMTDPVRQLGPSTDICYYPVVCANDSEQFYLNLTANVDQPLIVYRSVNNFVSYSRSEPRHFRITGGGSTQNGMRANIQMGQDGKPVITVLDVGTHAFYRLKWNGATWDSTMITNDISGLAERGYAYADMNGRGHLIYMRDADNRWFHWWNTDGVHWAVDTPSVVNWSGLGAQQFSVVNSGSNARLYMFYMVQNGADSSICLKTWTESDGWDPDSTIIVQSAHCTWPQCPPYVPADYDSVAVIWKSNATNLVYEVNVAAVPAGVVDTVSPGPVTDLRSSSTTASSVTLTWTAPGNDGDIGTASVYDLRISSSSITSTNWNSASEVSGVPAPLPAGSEQTFTISGLNESTTYYFALKTADQSDNWSALSDIASATTADATPPARITDLNASPSSQTGVANLSWTAPGDDGNTGTATRYDIRYSLSPISSSTWNSASQSTGEPTPLPAGSTQSFSVSNLNPGDTYYFAMMTADEAGNWSGLSNVASATLPIPADTIPPAAITNLKASPGTAEGAIDLTWTSTGDDGSVGTAGSYIVRYALDSITDSSWPTATTYPSPPQPQPSGSTEYLTLIGLTPGQRYFVAIKAVDNEGNRSSLSNVPSARAFQQGKVDVSTPLAVGYTTSDHALLSLPSYRGGRNGDTLIIVSSQFGSDQTGWIVSYDRGNTWHDVRARWMTMRDGTETWYSHSHSGAAFAGGLHIGFRGYASTDPSGYRYIKSPYTSEDDMETVRFPDAPLNGYYPIVVANSANDVWFFDISESSNRNNLRCWHSTDRFATPVTPQRVCSISEDPQNYWRMGVVMDANGYPKVSIFRFRGGFTIWTYNPATQTFDSTLVVSADIGGLGRSYAQAELNGMDHIVYTGGTSGDLVHFYETSPGHFDSTVVSSSNVDVYAPQLCVYGDGPSAKLYVAYVDHDTSVCVKGWTATAGWDADSIVVTGPGQAALDPALVPQIPSSWGFLPVWYHNIHNDSLYFVKVNLSSPLASPGGGIASVTVDRSLELLDSLARVDSANAKAESAGALLPREYKLSQNYPNPFNPTTTIEYDLPKDSRVLLTVTNILGQTVSTLVDRNQPAGRYRVEWDGKEADGREAATGIYLCHLIADEYQQTTKMVLLR